MFSSVGVWRERERERERREREERRDDDDDGSVNAASCRLCVALDGWM